MERRSRPGTGLAGDRAGALGSCGVGVAGACCWTAPTGTCTIPRTSPSAWGGAPVSAALGAHWARRTTPRMVPAHGAGGRPRDSARAGRCGPATLRPTPTPQLPMSASTITNDAQFPVGSCGSIAGSTSRTSGSVLILGGRASLVALLQVGDGQLRLRHIALQRTSPRRARDAPQVTRVESTRCAARRESAISRVSAVAIAGIARRWSASTSAATDDRRRSVGVVHRRARAPPLRREVAQRLAQLGGLLHEPPSWRARRSRTRSQRPGENAADRLPVALQ